MRFSCSCGVFIGFILAMMLSGAAYYYFHLRDNPDLTDKVQEQIEESWDHVKDTGDGFIEKTKKFTRK